MPTMSKQVSYQSDVYFVPSPINIIVPESFARRSCAGFAQLGINTHNANGFATQFSVQVLVESL